MEDELLTTKEAARLLRFSPGQVRSLVNRGQLRATKLGHKSLRFRRSDVEAFLTRHAHGAAPPEARVLTVAQLLDLLRSPDAQVRLGAMLLLSYSIGVGLSLGCEHAIDVEHIIAPQLSALLGRAAAGDVAAVDVLAQHLTAALPAAARERGGVRA